MLGSDALEAVAEKGFADVSAAAFVTEYEAE